MYKRTCMLQDNYNNAIYRMYIGMQFVLTTSGIHLAKKYNKEKEGKRMKFSREKTLISCIIISAADILFFLFCLPLDYMKMRLNLIGIIDKNEMSDNFGRSRKIDDCFGLTRMRDRGDSEEARGIFFILCFTKRPIIFS